MIGDGRVVVLQVRVVVVRVEQVQIQIGQLKQAILVLLVQIDHLADVPFVRMQ